MTIFRSALLALALFVAAPLVQAEQRLFTFYQPTIEDLHPVNALLAKGWTVVIVSRITQYRCIIVLQSPDSPTK